MDVMKAIVERRSVRKYKSDPVPEEILAQVLEAARAAPSWANTQVSRYVVVKDPGVKQALAETLPETNPGRRAIVEAPIVICLFARREVSGYYKGVPATNKGDWFMFDAGIAMEHIALAAWNLGLGTVHVGMFDAAMADLALAVPQGFSIVEMTPLGYFEETPRATPRKPLKELVFLDRADRPYFE